MVTQEIKNKINGLSDEDRASLASYILHSFSAPDYDVSDEAVTKRMQDLQSGIVQELDHETLIAGLRLRDPR